MNRNIGRYGRTTYRRIGELLSNYGDVLPEICYSASMETKEVIILKRGEKGFWKTNWGSMKDYETALAIAMAKNDEMEITPEQYDAMEVGSHRGFGGVYANLERDYDTRLYLLGELPLYDDFEENSLMASLHGVGLYLETGEEFKQNCGQMDAEDMGWLNAVIAGTYGTGDHPIFGVDDIKSHHIIMYTAEDPGNETHIFENPKEVTDCVGYLGYYDCIERDRDDYAEGKYIDRRFDFSDVTENFGMDDTAVTEGAYKTASAVMEETFAEMQDLMLGRIENAYRNNDQGAAREAFMRYHGAVNPVTPQFEAFVCSVAEATGIPFDYLNEIGRKPQDRSENEATNGMELK